MTAKKIPPSRKKYEQRKPVFSVRMPKEWHEAVKLFLQKTNQSRETFMGLALNRLTENYNQAYAQGFAAGAKKGFMDGKGKAEESKKAFEDGKKEGIDLGEQQGYTNGYWQGKKEWAIEVKCCRCGKPFNITPNSKEHQVINEDLKRRFFHPECLHGP